MARPWKVPYSWPSCVRSALLDVAGMAHAAIVYTRSWAADSPLQRVRLAGKLDQARQEVALLREELRIKDQRMARLPARHRPFYPPTERLAILELKAMRGWNLEQAAETFLVESATIASWLARIDEEGAGPLLRTATPINRLPDFAAYAVRRLKVLCPAMGKRRIADTLARAGLRLAATSVGRILRRGAGCPPPVAQAASPSAGHVVAAREPNHVWHVDLTAVPTSSGFWVSWLPFSLPPVWPFAFRVAFVVDHFSRRCMAFQMFRSEPTSTQIRALLGRTIRAAGRAPQHLISDQGSQFTAKGFKAWCRRKSIRQRFGAVGKYGSIAIVERFIRSFKQEHVRRCLLPSSLADIRGHVAAYVEWYNRFRPHQSLDGKTPDEIYRGASVSPPTFPAHDASKFELVVTRHRGLPHLPIVELRKAA